MTADAPARRLPTLLTTAATAIRPPERAGAVMDTHARSARPAVSAASAPAEALASAAHRP
jgi:hypothetical protein